MNPQEQELALKLMRVVIEQCEVFAKEHGLTIATLLGQHGEKTSAFFKNFGFVPTEPIEVVPFVRLGPPAEPEPPSPDQGGDQQAELPKEQPLSLIPGDGASKTEAVDKQEEGNHA
jgi:hypothetical protein